VGNVSVYLADIVIIAVISTFVVAYLGPHLQALLIELCDTIDRARFWVAFSNISIVLVSVVFALAYKPNIVSGESAVFESGNQLKYALMGLILTIGILALVISSFIPRARSSATPR
jgi:hypothetical protein